MGMTVFSGMLVATILGVLPDSDVVRGCRESHRRLEAPGARARRRAARDAGDGARTRGALRWRDAGVHSFRLVLMPALVAAGWMRASVPTTRVRRCRVPHNSVSSRTQPRNRWPTRRGSRCSTIRRCRRSSGRRSPTTSICASRSPASKRRAPAPASRSSFLYPQIDGTANYGVRQASDAQKESTSNDEDTTHQSGTYGFQLSWELDLFGRIRREKEGALAFVLASDQARRGVLVTLIGDVATNYFLLRELDLQLEIARQTLRLNDETVTYFRNRLDGGVSNRLELDRIVANRARTAARFPKSNSRSPSSRTRCHCCSDDRLDRSREPLSSPEKPFRRLFRPAFRRRCSSGAPTSRRPSSSWLRRTPTSAWRRRCSFRRSA